MAKLETLEMRAIDLTQKDDDKIASLPIFAQRILVLCLIFLGFAIGLISALMSPLLGVGIACAVIVGIVGLLRPQLVTSVTAFLIYANLPVVATLHGVPAILAAGAVLLLGLPFLYYLLVRRQEIVINQPFVLMIIYLALTLISALISKDISQSYERIYTYVLEGMILYFLFINTIRSPESLKAVIWAMIAAGILMGTLSIFQTATGNYENEFWGLARTKEATLSISEEDFFGNKDRTRRSSGPIGSKNRYGQVMVVLLPLAAVRVLIPKEERYLKLLAMYAVVPIIAGSFLTYSRGAGITVIAVGVFLVLLRAVPIWKSILIGIAGVMAVTIAMPGFAYRFGSVLDVFALFGDNVQEEADGAIRGRATVNLAGIYIFFDNPWFGVGPGQSPNYVRAVGNEVGFRWLTSDRRLHNMFIEELADTGLIGITSFLSIILATLKLLNDQRMRWKDKNDEYYFTSIGMIVAILAYLVSAVFLHLSYIRYFWFLMAVAGATAIVYNNEYKLLQKASKNIEK